MSSLPFQLAASLCRYCCINVGAESWSDDWIHERDKPRLSPALFLCLRQKGGVEEGESKSFSVAGICRVVDAAAELHDSVIHFSSLCSQKSEITTVPRAQPP